MIINVAMESVDFDNTLTDHVLRVKACIDTLQMRLREEHKRVLQQAAVSTSSVFGSMANPELHPQPDSISVVVLPDAACQHSTQTPPPVEAPVEFCGVVPVARSQQSCYMEATCFAHLSGHAESLPSDVPNKSEKGVVLALSSSRSGVSRARTVPLVQHHDGVEPPSKRPSGRPAVARRRTVQWGQHEELEGTTLDLGEAEEEPMPPTTPPVPLPQAGQWCERSDLPGTPTESTAELLNAPTPHSSLGLGCQKADVLTSPAKAANASTEGGSGASALDSLHSGNAYQEQQTVNTALAEASPMLAPEIAFNLHATWESLGVSRSTAGPQLKRLSSKDLQKLTGDLTDLDEDEVDMDFIDRFMTQFMLHPLATRRMTWELVGFVLILYDTVTIPLMALNPPSNALWLVMPWLVRAFWSSDFFVSGVTCYHRNDGVLETRFQAVARHYVCSWMLVDLLLLLLAWLETISSVSEGARGTRGLKSLRAIRAFRLLRVFKLMKTIPDIFRNLSFSVRSEWVLIMFDILKVMVFLITVVHFVSCAWYAIGDSSDSEDRGWVRVYGLGDNAPMWQRYVMSFHWSMTQFHGTSEISPDTLSERTFVNCVLVFAFLVSVSIVSSITTSMTRLQIVASHYSQQLAQLQRYLVDNSISHRLSMRVRQNAQHAVDVQLHMVNEYQVVLFESLSLPLRIDLHYEINGPILKWHSFFKSWAFENVAAMRQVCHCAVSRISVSKGDVLFSSGEHAVNPRMYFVINGALQYFCGPVGSNVQSGAWLSEAVLWTDWVHCGTMMVRSACTMACVDAATFHSVAKKFQGTMSIPAEYAKSFVHELNATCRDSLSDLHCDGPNVAALSKKVFPQSERRQSGLGSMRWSIAEGLKRLSKT